MSAVPVSTPPAVPVMACLCAAWCDTCEAYRATFAALAAAHPAVEFRWVDIEDHADALDALADGAPEIENFPTLLLADGTGRGFFGTVLPHASVAERMLREMAQGSLPVLAPSSVALAAVVRGLPVRAGG